MKIELTVAEAKEILGGKFPPCMPSEMVQHLKTEAARVANEDVPEMDEPVFENRFNKLMEMGYELDPELTTDLKPLWHSYVSAFGTEIANVEYAAFKARLANSEGIELVHDGSHFFFKGYGKKVS